MNGKNILKVLGISFAVIVVILAGLMFWGLSKLPSAFEIKQSITPPALKKTAAISDVSNQNSPAQPESLPEKEADSPTEDQNAKLKDEDLKQASIKVILEDFSDPRKPLIDSCRHMAFAPDSGFLKDSKNASGRYFLNSLSQPNDRDPLPETAAPILRTVFRAPGMDNVIDMILKSEEQKDPGVLKKAEFYYEMYRAGSYLKDHVNDLNRVLQQSYNLHNLMKAVAKKPELAKMPEVMNFCDDLERNLNDNNPNFDADSSSKEMLSFLEQNGLKAEDIGFDPKYRSKVKLNISNTQLNLNDAWIAQLFAADIEKAMKEKQTK